MYFQDGRGGYRPKPAGPHDYAKKQRVTLQNSRKLECPATLQIRCIEIYEEYFLDKKQCKSSNSLKTAKQAIKKKLNEALVGENATEIRKSTRFYLKIPLNCVHQRHPVGTASTIGQYVDNRVVKKIYDFVKQNITNVTEVKRWLDHFLENDLFRDVPKTQLPKKTNRRYYPSRQDLRNHIGRAISAFKYCDDDQESLAKKIDEWKTKDPTSKFFYRMREETAERNNETKRKPGEKTFLFVHQEQWQQRLLQRYGDELVLMDATYKTTKYAMPLFFICVHTNIGYKVVAEFMSQTEEKESISEALAIIKSWNANWNPNYFMIDYSTAEIGAIGEQFPSATVYVCDFDRIQAMQRWAKAKKNNLTTEEQETFLKQMQRISYASKESEFNAEVDLLRKCKFYEKVKDYVENTWLSCSSRWAHAFRQQQAVNVVNTNNGTEAMNKLFKYEYLPRSVDKSVYGIATTIVESFIPDSYQQYMQSNLMFSSAYRRYNKNVPAYLQDRPPQFVKHCLKSRYAAAEYQCSDISTVNFQKGEFNIRSKTNPNEKHLVNLSTPECSCKAWKKTQYPCKHFFAVFSANVEWSFDSLPDNYKNSVFITLDNEHIKTNKADNSVGKMGEDLAVSDNPNNFKDNMDVDMDGCDNSLNLGTSAHLSSAPNSEETNLADVSKEGLQHQDISKLRKVLHEKLDALKNLSYLVDTVTNLEKAIESVEEIHQKLLTSCPKQNGIPLRCSPVKKKLKISKTEFHQVFHKSLPKRKKWKRRGSPNRLVIGDELETRPTEGAHKKGVVSIPVENLQVLFILYLFSFVETPRKFIIAELSIRKLGSSSVLIISEDEEDPMKIKIRAYGSKALQY